MKRYILSLLLCVMACGVHAQGSADSLEVSILTCSPGDKVYSLYGHTAIRCQNFTTNLDVVFNYGVFSFEQPHFLWHFVLGECDYMVMPIPWDIFIGDYELRGSSVTQQTLNLSADEARAVVIYLMNNCRPENREYRYNYLYNNCTTKVRDVIEAVLQGQVEYPAQQEALSFRQHIHRYTGQYPWAQEGNDALLGAEVDKPIGEHEAMFLPENLMHFLDGAVIREEDGHERPLLKKSEIVLQEDISKKPTPSRLLRIFTPTTVGMLLLLFSIAILLYEYFGHRWLWVYDVCWLVLRGLTGMLLCFMFFFSSHPAVGSNWLVMILNPLAFVGLFLVVRAGVRDGKTHWFVFDFAILALFIVFSLLGLQHFGKLVVPLALVLITRPISYYLYRRKKR